MFQSPIHHEKKKHRRHHTTAGLRHSISESSLVTMEDSAVLKTVDDLAKSILHYGSSRVSKLSKKYIYVVRHHKIGSNNISIKTLIIFYIF